MTPAIIFEGDGWVSCVIPNVAVIADKAPREVVAAKLDALGLRIDDAELVDAETFRSAMRSALVGSVESLSEQVDAIEDVQLAAELRGQIVELRLYCDKLRVQQNELQTLASASLAAAERANAIEASRQAQVELDRAERVAVAEREAIAAEDAKWKGLSLRVFDDGSVDLLRDVRRATAWDNQGRATAHRTFKEVVKRWKSIHDVPADVRRRYGK